MTFDIFQTIFDVTFDCFDIYVLRRITSEYIMVRQVFTTDSPLSLSQWAAKTGITYRTAWRMTRAGKLPKGLEVEQLPTGTIRLREKALPPKTVENKDAVIYARIPNDGFSRALNEQIQKCKSFCFAKGWVVRDVIKEEAPGLGSRRYKLARMLKAGPCRLVIASPTVLTRYDFDLVELSLISAGFELVVIDRSEETHGEGGALEDLIHAVSITCRRHYGRKRGALLVEMLQKVISQGF
jgi:putative resolvase